MPEEVVGASMLERSFALASLGISQGGVGVRSSSAHAAAAYVASVWNARGLCQAIDRDFDPSDAVGGLVWAQTLGELSGSVLEPARGALAVDAPAMSQKRLSQLIDAASKDRLVRECRTDVAFRAHVGLCSLPTAGAWLTAPPADDGRDFDAPLFKVALKRRLRVPVYDADDFCPACGDCLDRFGDHALVCPCKGSRTVRHNALRNDVFEMAGKAGTQPEREKAGLLPKRPADDGIMTGTGGRRPADVWVPRGPDGRGEALDFACAPGLRADLLPRTADAPETVFAEYEAFKRGYKTQTSSRANKDSVSHR